MFYKLKQSHHMDATTRTDGRELFHNVQWCSEDPARKLRRNHMQLKVQGRLTEADAKMCHYQDARTKKTQFS